MDIVKSSTLNGVGLVIKIGFMLAVNKLIALWMGANGLALYGQFQSVMTLMNGIAAAPAQAGIVRMTAANQSNIQLMHEYWSAARFWVICSSLVISMIGCISASYLAETLLQNPAVKWPLILCFFTVPCAALFTLILSCANGLFDIKRYVIINIIISIVLNISVILGVWSANLYGLIIAFAVGQIIALFCIGIYANTTNWFSWKYFFVSYSSHASKDVIYFALMALTAIVSNPIVFIIIRHMMSSIFDLNIVGYWQAVTRFGELYMTAATALLGVYYFPKFSAANSRELLYKEIKFFFFYIYPIFVFGYMFFVIYRDTVIVAMYSNELLPAAKLMVWQMLSDSLRIVAWLFGYLAMAQGTWKAFVVVEVVTSILWVILAWILMQLCGYQGAIYASAISYILYTLLLFINLKKGNKI